MWLVHHLFEHMAKNPQELCLVYKDAIDGYEDENRQVAEEREKVQAKRLKNPQRYRCAAVRCGVEADSGKILSRCTSSLFPPSEPVLTTGGRLRKMRHRKKTLLLQQRMPES